MTTRWTEADYEALSWHDNHVHGLEIHEDHNEVGVLTLHLDYILQWLPQADGRYSFVIAPAVLRFREVRGLRVELDYLGVAAAMTPFSIGSIAREASDTSFRWQISMNWPEGYLTFESPGFVQELVGGETVTDRQCLSPRERERLPARVQLHGEAIIDWSSFHDQCAAVFGFHDFYGRNMNAWIDCLTYVREGDGMSRFALGASTPLLIEVVNSKTFKQRAPEVFDALVDCVAAVNQRQIEMNEAPALNLVLL